MVLVTDYIYAGGKNWNMRLLSENMQAHVLLYDITNRF